MRRFFLVFLAVFACLSVVLVCEPRGASAGYASLVIDADSGTVLHSVNANRHNYPASLTKMMTLYMTFDALDSGRLKPNQKLVVSRVAARRSPSKLWLRRGQRISVRSVIHALVTKSANDAATVIAEALGGSERKFARMMTKQARVLGMTQTVFRNASGLPDWRQLSTAKDMATLARALLRDFPQHYHNFSLKSFRYRGRTYRNHNRLLRRYVGVDGIKTGYTRASGFNLVASVERNGRRLIGVIFGAESSKWRDRHMARLLDKGFVAVAKVPKTTKLASLGQPPRPKRKPERPASDDDWSIQVGAFERFATAHLAITRAARAVPALMRTSIAIEPDASLFRPLYRARLVGLSEKMARRSCSKLIRKNIKCVVLPVDEVIGQGSR